MSAVSGQRLARAKLSTNEAMQNDVLGAHIKGRSGPLHGRRAKMEGRERKYCYLQYIGGNKKGEARHPGTAKYQFEQSYFEAIEYFE